MPARTSRSASRSWRPDTSTSWCPERPLDARTGAGLRARPFRFSVGRTLLATRRVSRPEPNPSPRIRMPRCPACDSVYADDLRDCPDCAAAAADEPAEVHRCPVCGEEYSGADACPACGTLREEVPCDVHPDRAA